MKVKEFFIGAGGIRSFWRIVIFVLITLVLVRSFFWVLVYALHYSEESNGWTPIDFLIEAGLSFFSALIAAKIMTWIEKRSFSDYGLPSRQAFGSLFWVGMLFGFGSSAVEILLIYFAGGASFHGLALHGSALLSSAVLWLVAMIFLGLWEEFLYRGYPLTTLATGIGFWPSSIVFSLLFGAAHLAKPMENWIDISSIIFYGLLWCLSLKRTGSIWFAIGFHAMSDYSDMVLFAAPNTGNEGRSLSGHILDITYHGPEWLTGGPRGIEASLLVFVILAVSFLLLHRLYPSKRFPA